MGLISWIIVGGLGGWLGSKVMGTQKMGIIANIVVGIIGGFIGGIIIGLLGGTGVTGLNLWSILVAFVGSLVFLWLAKKLRK